MANRSKITVVRKTAENITLKWSGGWGQWHQVVLDREKTIYFTRELLRWLDEAENLNSYIRKNKVYDYKRT